MVIPAVVSWSSGILSAASTARCPAGIIAASCQWHHRRCDFGAAAGQSQGPRTSWNRML